MCALYVLICMSVQLFQNFVETCAMELEANGAHEVGNCVCNANFFDVSTKRTRRRPCQHHLWAAHHTSQNLGNHCHNLRQAMSVIGQPLPETTPTFMDDK